MRMQAEITTLLKVKVKMEQILSTEWKVSKPGLEQGTLAILANPLLFYLYSYYSTINTSTIFHAVEKMRSSLTPTFKKVIILGLNLICIE